MTTPPPGAEQLWNEGDGGQHRGPESNPLDGITHATSLSLTAGGKTLSRPRRNSSGRHALLGGLLEGVRDAHDLGILAVPADEADAKGANLVL